MLQPCPVGRQAPPRALVPRSRQQQGAARSQRRRATPCRAQASAAARESDADAYYPLWGALPIQPGPLRRTRRIAAGPGFWLFEQTQGVLDVIVNTRMTVVQLRDGSLFVHAPVAPTRECLRLLRELNAPVKYIVLPTSAVEHKVFLGPFARQFPDAEVYAAPGQWSWPLNLPLSALGLFPRRLTGTLADGSTLRGGEPAPWANELEHLLLELPLGLGPFVEVVFFHKASKTLLVTDVVIAVPEDPPEICTVDPRPLLVRSKDSRQPLPADSREARRLGWGKTVLFALFFQPLAVKFGLAGFTWAPAWEESFARLRKPTLLVPPILQTIVLNKRPTVARTWIARVARWPFRRIIPAHLQAPVAAGPSEFVAAFDFLEPQAATRAAAPFFGLFAAPKPAAKVSTFSDGDMRTLRSIGDLVSTLGVIKAEPRGAE